MLLQLDNIPNDILEKIPLSIRLNSNGIIDTNNLPIEVLYELRNLEFEPKYNNYIENSTIDLMPNFNSYSDFSSLDSKKEAIKEYIKNFLLTDIGAYPFDPEFGTNLKRYINKLDTPTIKTLVHNELINIVNNISLSFNIPVKLKNIIFKEVHGNLYNSYNMKLFLYIENMEYELDLMRDLQ